MKRSAIFAYFCLITSFFPFLAHAQGSEKIKIEAGKVELKSEPAVTPAIPAKKLQIDITPAPMTVPFQPTVLQTRLAVELIVDASGSMNGLIGSESKMDILKFILQDLASQWATMDPPVQLAIRVFGAQYPMEANQCEDTELKSEFGPVDRTKIKNILEGITAKGVSPLSFALEKGGQDLIPKQNEDKVVILLTDGKDTCGADPCAISKMHYERYKVITHVVAFDITQSDESALKCIAQNSNGKFFPARNKEELASALDEALRSTIPYNLRLKVLVGGSPLPSKVTVYKAGTQNIVQQKDSFGIELFRLDPESYDILVEYQESIAKNKPSKILKGVALTEQGKIEQEIRFTMGSVTLAAHNREGKPAKAEFIFYQAGSTTEMARMITDGAAKTLFLEPGQYDLVANCLDAEGQQMSLSEKNIAINMEHGFQKDFAFQTGTIVLKGQLSNKNPVALHYKVSAAGNPDNIVLEGDVEKTGGNIELTPGIYDISVEAKDAGLSAHSQAKLENIQVEGGAIQEKIATLTIGTLAVKALKAVDQPAAAEFIVTDINTKEEMAKVTADNGKSTILLTPGKYEVAARLISTMYQQGPKTESKEIEIFQDKTAEMTLRFELGTLKLLGRNAKEQKMETSFYVYEGGTENLVASAGPLKGWVAFDLTIGNYDIKAEFNPGQTEIQSVWQRNVDIASNNLYVYEMVFTNAKLRLIGRGTNNEVIPVNFKIYKYGHDRPLLSGITGQDWQSFDINPDQYYIEASYSDPESSQQLKKWISLKVNENEFVEQELRF